MAVVCCWSRVERKTASVLFKNKLKPIQAAAPAESSPSMHRFQVSTICLHHEIWNLFESYWIELSFATATTNHTHLGRHNVQICRDDPKPTETKYREARSIKHGRFTLCWSQDNFWLITQLWSKIENNKINKVCSNHSIISIACSGAEPKLQCSVHSTFCAYAKVLKPPKAEKLKNSVSHTLSILFQSFGSRPDSHLARMLHPRNWSLRNGKLMLGLLFFRLDNKLDIALLDIILQSRIEYLRMVGCPVI